MASTRPVSLAKEAFQSASAKPRQTASALAFKTQARAPKPKIQHRVKPGKPFHPVHSESFTKNGPIFPTLISPTPYSPTPGFVGQLIDALKNVPVRLRKAVSDWGYTIITAPSIVTPQHSALPNPYHMLHRFIPGALLRKIQTDWTVTGWWKTLPSHSPLSPKTILMPEVGWQCQGMVAAGSMLLPIYLDSRQSNWLFKVDHFGLFPAPAQRPGLIMLHELGHAVDDFLGDVNSKGNHVFLSQSKAFNRAYQTDIASITDGMLQRELGYYLPRNEDPGDLAGRAKAEAFAQVFAHLRTPDYGNPYLQAQDAQFLAYFPRVATFIRKNVLRPWRWQHKPGHNELDSSKKRQPRHKNTTP